MAIAWLKKVELPVKGIDPIAISSTRFLLMQNGGVTLEELKEDVPCDEDELEEILTGFLEEGFAFTDYRHGEKRFRWSNR